MAVHTSILLKMRFWVIFLAICSYFCTSVKIVCNREKTIIPSWLVFFWRHNNLFSCWSFHQLAICASWRYHKRLPITQGSNYWQLIHCHLVVSLSLLLERNSLRWHCLLDDDDDDDNADLSDEEAADGDANEAKQRQRRQQVKWLNGSIYIATEL